MTERIIVIEKPFGGWARSPAGASTVTLAASVEAGEDQYGESTVASLFRFERYGDIAPGEMFQDMSGTTAWIAAGLPLNGVVASNSEAFVMLSTGTLIQFGAGDNVIDGSFVIGTSHTTSTDQDLICFTAADGTEWVAWSYERQDSAAEIARIKVSVNPPALQSDAWFSGLTGSGTLTKSVPHKMWIGPDRIFYTCNGRYIASHDPATSSGNAQAFDLGAGWVAVAGVGYGNYNAIVARKASTALAGFQASESLLLLWDGFTPTPNYVFSLNDFEVTGIKNVEGQLFIFTQGNLNLTRVKTLIGNQIITIFESGGTGNSPKQTAIELYKGLVCWLQDAANFNMSAIQILGNGRYAHHEIMYPHATTASIGAVGMLKNLTGNGIYVGNTVGGINNIWRINHSSYYPNAEFKTRLRRLSYRSNIKEIRVYFSQFGAGASVTLSLFKDYSAMSVGGANDLLNKQLTNSALGAITEFVIPVFIPNISSFYMNFRFDHASATNTAAIISKVEAVVESVLNKDA